MILAILALAALAAELLLPLTVIGRSLMWAMLSALGLSMLLALLLARKEATRPLAPQVLLATVFVVPVAGAFALGGPAAPSLPIAAIVPVLATLIAGRRAAFAWTAVLLASFGALIALDRGGFAFLSVMRESNRPASLLIVQTLMSLAVVGVTLRHRAANERLRAELSEERARLATLAGTDPLTGVANRRSFDEHLVLARERSRRTKSGMGVVLFDLDTFKTTNDRFGHTAGDAVLAEVGRRLTGVTRRIDLVARLGGDEFAVVLENVGSAAELEAVGQKLAQTLEPPLPFRGEPLTCSASHGVAHHPEDAEDLEALLERADFRMYRCKKERRRID